MAMLQQSFLRFSGGGGAVRAGQALVVAMRAGIGSDFASLKAEIDREAWDTLHSDLSRPFPKPATGRWFRLAIC